MVVVSLLHVRATAHISLSNERHDAACCQHDDDAGNAHQDGIVLVFQLSSLWLKLVGVFLGIVAEHVVNHCGSDEADDGSHQQVAGIVNAEVDARIAHRQSPEGKEDVEPAPSHEIHRKECHAPGVGGMGGWESVSATTIVEGDMYQRRDGVVEVAGAHPFHHRLEQGGGSLVADEDAHHDGHHARHRHLVVEVTYHDVEKCRIKWHPCESVCEHCHEVIPVCIMKAIQKEKYLCINLA